MLCFTFWAQNTDSVSRLHILQKKSLRVIFFQNRNSHTGPLFKVSKIRKSFHKTALEKYIFISKSLKRSLPPIFNGWFKFFLSHTLMIIDGPILAILKNPLTVLKPMVDIQCLLIRYMFGITYKVVIKLSYFIS